MCRALVSAHGLKNDVNYTRSAFVLAQINERDIFMCSALVSLHGLKTEVNYTRSALVLAHGLKNEVYSCVGRLCRLMD